MILFALCLVFRYPVYHHDPSQSPFDEHESFTSKILPPCLRKAKVIDELIELVRHI